MEPLFFKKEQELITGGMTPIGVDEAGRGPLAGPVVAAAVCFRDPAYHIPPEREKDFALIRDSKKLSEKQREKAFAVVGEYFYTGVGTIGHETIDRVNILEATFLAMKAALADLRRVIKGTSFDLEQSWILLIDGNQTIPNLSLQQEAIVDGDALVKSIAAASIIAKVTRDRMMLQYDQTYPQYGFAKHKGYGTSEHLTALRKYGPSPLHRRSFRPVQLANPEDVNRRFASILKPKKG